MSLDNSNMKKCPKCQSENTYPDGLIFVCADCFYEWNEQVGLLQEDLINDEDTVVKDANGNILVDGDSVVAIKDIKVKGSSTGIKSGTKIKNIKLFDLGDGHNISCKVDGIGAINLKSILVKKG